MNPIDNLIERKFASLQTSTAVVLPGGRRLGAADAEVTLIMHELGPLAHLAAGQVGELAGDYVEVILLRLPREEIAGRQKILGGLLILDHASVSFSLLH